MTELLAPVENYGVPKLPTPGALSKKPKGSMGSEELYQIAVNSGFQQEADSILQDKGEEANEIFSGGLLMDIIDVLNSLQYGIVGTLKGKGFLEGVRTRQSFSDKDALGEHGIPGTIAGIILDIAADPLTYIPPAWLLKVIPGGAKAGKAVKGAFEIAGKATGKVGGKAIEKVVSKQAANQFERAAQWTTKMFLGAQGADEVYARTNKLVRADTAVASKRIIEMGKVLTNVDDEIASKIPSMFMRNADGSIGLAPKADLPNLFAGKHLQAADNLWDDTVKLQNGLVKEGVLAEGDFSYMANLYDAFEGGETVAQGVRKGLKVGGPRLKHRKLIYETPVEVEAKVTKLKEGLFKKHSKAISEAELNLMEATTPGKIKSATKKLTKIQDDMARQEAKLRGFLEAKKANILKIRAEHGEITDSIYPVVKGLLQGFKELENASIFNKLAISHGLDDITAKAVGVSKKMLDEGYELIPKQKGTLNKFAGLSGKYVPKYIADDINEVMRMPGIWETRAAKAWGFFKWGHTAGNPATHGRNVISNMFLNWWKLGMIPGDPRTIKAQVLAGREMAKPGKWIKEIRPLGYNLDTFATAELKHMYAGPEFAKAAKGFPAKVKSTISKFMEKTGDIYQGAENHAKLSAHIYNRTVKGMGAEQAWRMAEAATFDYNAVSPLIRKIRTSIWGVPFLTFSVKAAPLVAETAFKHPGRISVLGKVKNAIENMSDIEETKRERASEPQWLRDGFYIKLPMKDKHGRSAYFDLTYIIPFGDLASGQFFQRQVDRETGLPESYAESMIQKAPVINMITEIGKNQDFYGNKIWKEADSSEKQIVDLTRHISKMYLPPLAADLLPGGYRTKGKKAGQRRPSALKRAKEAEGTQYRTGMQEIMRMAGLKIQPIDENIQSKYFEWEKAKALETLLGEKGLIRKYERTYVPK